MRESESEFFDVKSIALPLTTPVSFDSLPSMASSSKMMTRDSAYDSIQTSLPGKDKLREFSERNKRTLYKMEKKLNLNSKYLEEHKSTLSKQDKAKLKAEIQRMKEEITSFKGQVEAK